VTVEVELRPELNADFEALPDGAIRWQVMKFLARLRTEPYLGSALRNHPVLGDLSDCHKIYVGETAQSKPTHRIVYRLLPTVDAPTSVDVIVIGKKASADPAVYLEALRRLSRNRFANPS
jgi:hypothetical protein